MLVLALAVMGGIGLGAGVALLRELMDRVFRTGAQLQAALQMPCLALVPLLKGTKPNKFRAQAATWQRHFAERSFATRAYFGGSSTCLCRVCRINSLNQDGDQFKETDRPHKVIGFTSSLPNEGKSTIAGALAQLIAQTGRRVIVVDCDLRNPTLSRCLAPRATTGIVDVISGVRSLEEAVWRDPTTNLVFLPATGEAPLFYSSETLG